MPINPEQYQCTRCGVMKDAVQFYTDKRALNGLSSACRACILDGQKARRDAMDPSVKKAMYDEWNSRSREYRRGYHLQRKYGLTVSEFDALVESQNGVCAACGVEPDRFHVDHDHATGRVRGLLCHQCNVALGLMRENPDLINGLAMYAKENC